MKYFNSHRLSVSQTKTKILSFSTKNEKQQFIGDFNPSPIHFDCVLSLKYLGIPFSNNTRSLFKEFNIKIIEKAESYSRAIFSFTREQFDRSISARLLWLNSALPSILYGCEVIPLSIVTIDRLQCIQNQIGKCILKIPKSSSNAAVAIDAGLMPIKFMISQRVLSYIQKFSFLELNYWPRKAFEWTSLNSTRSSYQSYIDYCKSILVTSPNMPQNLKDSINSSTRKYIQHLRDKTYVTSFSLNMPFVNELFKLKPWVHDGYSSKVYAMFRCNNANLGNRYPNENGYFTKLCKLCADPPRYLNNESHIVISCKKFEPIRRACILHKLLKYYEFCYPHMSDDLKYAKLMDNHNPRRLYIAESLVMIYDAWIVLTS